MNNPRRNQNLISDEMAELLADEGAMKRLKKCNRIIERMILYGEQIRHKRSRKFEDDNYRIDEV